MKPKPPLLKFGVLLVLLVAVTLWIGCQDILKGLGGQNPGGGGAGGDGPADPMNDTDWSALKTAAMANIRVAPGWSTPALVPGDVNSTGWEDSASIAPDGNTLYFAYIPCDFHGLAAKERMNLEKFGRYRRGPGRGTNPEFAFDVFQSRRQGGAFGAPEKHRVSVDTTPIYSSESGLSESEGAVYYNSNLPTTPQEGTVHVWRAAPGKAPVKLGFCSTTDECDPTFRNGELFFWSEHRAGGMGGGRKHLWMTRQTGDNTWSAPVCLPEPINTPNSDSWQCHLTADGRLVFTSDRDGWLSIWSSQRTGPSSWAAPVRIVWPEPGSAVAGVAEPSLTEDGKHLYFCVLFKNPSGAHDLDIASTSRP